MTDMISTICPNCLDNIDAPSISGKKVKCPSCQVECEVVEVYEDEDDCLCVVLAVCPRPHKELIMDMQELKFANATFKSGLNLTIRRGDKWHQHNGEKVQLADLDGNKFEIVTIYTTLKPFNEITPIEFNFEHDPACREYSGAVKDMREVYDGFEEHELVTLVWLRLDQRF